MVEIGKRYGNLVCLGKDKTRDSRYYLFKCDCGNVCSKVYSNVQRGATRSCGCYQSAFLKAGKAHRKHGGRGERLYHVWKSMRSRCYEVNNKGYKNYGGRGIKICDEWKDYAVFREWALANGYDKDAKRGITTIERIDVNKDYSPDNCTFADTKQQARNRTSNHFITVNGETHCIAEWEEIRGLGKGEISARLYRGWSEYDAVLTN